MAIELDQDPFFPHRRSAFLLAISWTITVSALAAFAPWPIAAGLSLTLCAIVAGISWQSVLVPLAERLAASRRAQNELATQLEISKNLRTFEADLDRAISMADNDADVLALLGKSLTRLLPDRDNYILLSPPDQPRVTWSIEAGPAGLRDPVALGQAARCCSLSTAGIVVSSSSSAIDACPHLLLHEMEVSSVCVPIQLEGGFLGVAHSVGPAGDLPDSTAVLALDLVARRCGSRLQALRRDRREDRPIAHDPLTGLPTHTHVHRLLRELRSKQELFSLALCDIDGFSSYNAAHGSDIGDLALILFANVMSAALRPGDTVARFAGDRFICVFPHCKPENAQAAMERVREALVLELTTHELPPFTASVGIVDSAVDPLLDTVVELADVELLVAKKQGGNRVRVVQIEQAAQH